MGTGWLSWWLAASLAAGSASGLEPIRGTNLVLTYELDNMAGVPARLLENAESELERIFRGVRIDLRRARWTSQAGGGYCLTPQNQSGLRVFVVGEATFRQATGDDRALGYTASTGGSRGRAAFVAYRRVLAMAARSGVPPARLLAHVIVHELAHLLLPGTAHSPRGVLQPGWWHREVASAAFGRLHFSPQQIAAIRASRAIPPAAPSLDACPAAGREIE